MEEAEDCQQECFKLTKISDMCLNCMIKQAKQWSKPY
jgi:hypothetical protein